MMIGRIFLTVVVMVVFVVALVVASFVTDAQRERWLCCIDGCVRKMLLNLLPLMLCSRWRDAVAVIVR